MPCDKEVEKSIANNTCKDLPAYIKCSEASPSLPQALPSFIVLGGVCHQA